MFQLQEVLQKTDKVFEPFGGMKLPEPPEDFRRKLEALEEAGLRKQRASLILDMRIWQAEKLGLQKMEPIEAISMLMGSEPTGSDETSTQVETHRYPWFYEHHNDEFADNWTTQARTYWRTERKALWYLPPFRTRELWRCKHGVPDYLKREIPYGVVLRMNELKRLKLFNCFSAIAPEQAWRQKETTIDPIILGNLCEITPREDGTLTGGRSVYFFIAQWK